VQHALNINIHANPLRASAPVTINPTTNIVALNANIVIIRTAVPPPFSRPKQSDNGSARRDCQMSRPGVTADVKFSFLCQRVKTSQGKAGSAGFSGSRR
jgi:hypothetical protein